MTTVNLLQKHFKQISYYTISNCYYILMHLLSVTQLSIIQQQIEGFFWRCSMAFTAMLCWQIYYGLLLKEHLPRTQENPVNDCLEHDCETSLELSDWSSTQGSLCLLTGETGKVNVQRCVMYWYLS